MRYPPRKPQKPDSLSALTSLADILPAVCRDLALDRKVNELALLALWPKQVEMLAGAVAASQSKAIRLKKQGDRTILVVKVASATLASELGFQVPALKDALNRFHPQTGIMLDQIQLSVGAF
ncbi:MAG TPA: DUF721 domain-containing protein [Coleofasciculaceae cyanobacterium]